MVVINFYFLHVTAVLAGTAESTY